MSTQGLILHLDGKTAPYTAPNKRKIWPDISGKGNHAEFFHTTATNFIHYKGNGYEFNNLSQEERSYMKLLNSLGNNQSFTLEIICRSLRPQATPFYSTAATDTDTELNLKRALNIHMPWLGTIYFDAPYNGQKGDASEPPIIKNGRLEFSGPESAVKYLSDFHYHAFRREKKEGVKEVLMQYFSDGKLMNGLTTETTNFEMTTTVIGNGVLGVKENDWMQGEIIMVRLYNRALPPAEILTNSRADKARYKY